MERSQILCPLDLGPCSNQVLQWTRYLTEGADASVTILHAGFYELPFYLRNSMLPGYQQLKKSEDQHLRDHLKRLGNGVLGHSMDWKTVVVDAPPSEAILDWIGDHPIDLVIMGSHGRRGVQRLFLGSVSENVMRHSRCPTLVVRTLQESPPSLERVMCPVSMAYLSRETLEMSSSIAARTGAQLYLLRAVDSITELGEQWKPLSEAVADEVRSQTQIFEVLKKGSAAERITDWAREHRIDLIVLGANHRPFLDFTTLGTTTEKVIRHSQCSVLVVPHQRKTQVKDSFISKREAPLGKQKIEEVRVSV